MELVQMNDLLKRSLGHNRYIHSVNTMNEAITLAERYGEDRETAAIAGLLHDCAKDLEDAETLKYCCDKGIVLNEVERKQVFLMHGTVGAIIAQESYGITDMAILNAIKYHTTGFGKMNLLDKIVFLADYIEPGRTHSEVHNVRKLAYVDINKALICSFDNIIRYVMKQNGLIHPFTIDARNSILMEMP